jgi:hypothetical protein
MQQHNAQRGRLWVPYDGQKNKIPGGHPGIRSIK